MSKARAKGWSNLVLGRWELAWQCLAGCEVQPMLSTSSSGTFKILIQGEHCRTWGETFFKGADWAPLLNGRDDAVRNWAAVDLPLAPLLKPVVDFYF